MIRRDWFKAIAGLFVAARVAPLKVLAGKSPVETQDMSVPSVLRDLTEYVHHEVARRLESTAAINKPSKVGVDGFDTNLSIAFTPPRDEYAAISDDDFLERYLKPSVLGLVAEIKERGLREFRPFPVRVDDIHIQMAAVVSDSFAITGIRAWDIYNHGPILHFDILGKS